MKLKIFLFGLLCSLFSLVSCGNDDDNWWDDGSRDVTFVKVNAQKANVGDIIHVDTYFETSISAGYPKDLELVIRLDPELQYMNGSSTLYIEGNGHRRSPDYIRTCDDGVVYLWYSLDNDDDLRYYTGDKKFNMRFNVVATAKADMAKVQAQANKNANYSCHEEFIFEEEDAVIIK
ncbi:MAG: hypothetical protein ACOX3T_04020 [Bdellovibrionota bacterium]